jgi:hypothetical protein
MLTSAREDVFQAKRPLGRKAGASDVSRRAGEQDWLRMDGVGGRLVGGVAETFLLLLPLLVSQGFNSHVTVVVQRAWWR